jgi:hypothetical protein
MNFDETGVLRALKERRGEAERNPLHPIRVIPAREVSGERAVFEFAPFLQSLPFSFPLSAWLRFRAMPGRFLSFAFVLFRALSQLMRSARVRALPTGDTG